MLEISIKRCITNFIMNSVKHFPIVASMRYVIMTTNQYKYRNTNGKGKKKKKAETI